jgi:hypothetical protein
VHTKTAGRPSGSRNRRAVRDDRRSDDRGKAPNRSKLAPRDLGHVLVLAEGVPEPRHALRSTQLDDMRVSRRECLRIQPRFRTRLGRRVPRFANAFATAKKKRVRPSLRSRRRRRRRRRREMETVGSRTCR